MGETQWQRKAQKHMLEHADGSGRPGVIINYNCAKFRCQDGMTVTKLGKILTLDEPELEKIRVFITE
jgi:hypothetical protein